MAFTENQLKAINSRNGSILVSAAAGSGKTSVLVERVIERITDENNKCPADSLLIVTFTNAAAAELRERIDKALSSRIEKDPYNDFLLKQKILLQFSQISTIDSFAISVVKENFNILGISPDFIMGDNKDLKLIRDEALIETLEHFYSEDSDNSFKTLVNNFDDSTSDNKFQDILIKVYNKSVSFAYPSKWLDTIASSYDVNSSEFNTMYLTPIINDIESKFDVIFLILDKIKGIIFDNADYAPLNNTIFNPDRAFFEEVYDSIKNADLKTVCDELTEHKFSNLVLKKYTDVNINDKIKALRDKYKKIYTDQIVNNYSFLKDCSSADELKEIIDTLVKCVKYFSDLYYSKKKDEGIFEFNDISHMLLNLLVTFNENGDHIPTEFAQEMRKNYSEILIDEYQDTNDLQDSIFEALSNNNLFRVGDVKQSIYMFRNAMPELFLKKRDRLDYYENDNYPAKVILEKNFRSSRGVVGFVNFIYSQLMSKEIAGSEYNDDEKLFFGADYLSEEIKNQAEFHLIKCSSSEYGKERVKAVYTAGLVKDLLESGRLINTREGLRPIKKSDICILMRSIKNRSKPYIEELQKSGINAYAEIENEFFNCTEINIIVSLLRVIDNPVQDIPLLSVMMSPVFGFTPDDIAEIRLNSRNESLYVSLLKCESYNKAVSDFLKTFRKWRFLSSTSAVSSLIKRIYDETMLPVLVLAMQNGEQRRNNLTYFLNYIIGLEQNKSIDLSSVIRLIDSLEGESMTDFGLGLSGHNNDAVKIITFHSSKGLQFPICILTEMDREYSRTVGKGDLIFAGNSTIGINYRNYNTGKKEDTIPYNAAKILEKKANLQEELRLIYVAMTRAQESLYIIGAKKEKDFKADILAYSDKTTFISEYSLSNCKSYLDWFILCLLRHKNAVELRNICCVDDNVVIKSDFDLNVVITSDEEIMNQNTETNDFDEDIINERNYSKEIYNQVKEKIEFTYSYLDLLKIPSKAVASDFEKNQFNMDYFAAKKPSFLNNGNLTGSGYGTLMHKVMELIDFKKAIDSLDDELNNLILSGALNASELKSVSKDSIIIFLNSDLCNRVINADRVFKEKQFSVSVPADLLYPQVDITNEKLMLQGIIDLAFVENNKVILVDYKTDKVDDEQQLIDNYRRQLYCYKYALNIITGFEVSEAYLYSFSLNKSVYVSFE